MFAASNNGVSTRFIEGHRLWVLLVDFEVGGVRKHVVEKRGTDAATAHVVMHKEHLQAALRGASETDRSPILLGDGQGDRWKIVRSELRLDGVTMCGGQKIMSRIHRAAPNRNQRGKLGGAMAGAKNHERTVCHGGTMRFRDRYKKEHHE